MLPCELIEVSVYGRIYDKIADCRNILYLRGNTLYIHIRQ